MLWKKKLQDEFKQNLIAGYSRLWRYCLILTSDKEYSSDLVQTTCLRALEKRHLYTPGTNFMGWVFKIAHNIWLNELRAKAIRSGGGIVTIDEIELPDIQPDAERQLYYQQVMQEIFKLPEAQRLTVVLVYVEGYSYKEASEILDIPIGTIMSRLSAARSKLATKLHDQQTSVL